MKHLFKTILLFAFIAVFTADVKASEFLFFPSEKIASDPHPALLRSPAIDVLYTVSAEDNKNYVCYNFGTKFGLLYFRSMSGAEYEFSGYGGA